jgi:hypothetical protein
VEFPKSSLSRNRVAAEFNSLAAAGFDPAVKIAGRYYANPSTDKQKIDLNVKAGAIINMLRRPANPERLCVVFTICGTAC